MKTWKILADEVVEKEEEEDDGGPTHNPETGAKYFRMSEVATHNIINSLWIVIDNKVYDITNFTLEHPGGEEILFEQGGQDASVPFEVSLITDKQWVRLRKISY